jgi:hypothetical protein
MLMKMVLCLKNKLMVLIHVLNTTRGKLIEFSHIMVEMLILMIFVIRLILKEVNIFLFVLVLAVIKPCFGNVANFTNP